MFKKFMDFLKRKMNRNVYHSFIISYLIFSVILCAINIATSSILRKRLVEEYNNSYQYTLSVFSDTFKQLTSSFSLSTSLVLKNTSTNRMYTLLEDKTTDNTDSLFFRDVFQDILTNNKQYICQLGIYFPGKNTILSNRGCQTAAAYYTDNYNLNNLLCNDWLQMLKDSPSYFIYEYSNSKYLYYTHHTAVDNIPAVIFSCAKLQKYYLALEDIYDSTNANIALYNKNSNIILTNDNFTDKFQNFLNTGAPHYSVLESSASPGWVIYLLNDGAFYTASVRNLNSLMYLTIVVYLIFVFIMSKYFSSRHYAPIKALVKNFSTVEEPTGKNEFVFLQHSINTLINKNNIYISKNVQREKENNLKNFVTGSTDIETQIQTLFSETEKNNLWAVAILKLTDLSANKMADAGYTQIDIDTIFMNICQEILEQVYQVNVFPVEGYYCCLINSSNINKSSLEALFTQIIKSINFYFNINFTVCVSGMNANYKDVPVLFKNASEIMIITEFLRTEQSQIRFYDDLTQLSLHKISNTAMKNKIVQLIQHNQPEKATALLSDAIDTSINDITSTDMLNEIIYEILVILTYTVDQIFKTENEPVPDRYVPIRTLFPYKNINELKENIRQYLVALCEHVLSQTPDLPLEQKIVKYIKENYNNPDLDATVIGEKFHIHSAHLSRLFKEHFNIGMHQYISQLRIDEAKKMLCETDKRIEDIGVLVGYNNIYSFSRAFKRLTGCSPIQYRSSGRKNL